MNQKSQNFSDNFRKIDPLIHFDIFKSPLLKFEKRQNRPQAIIPNCPQSHAITSTN